MSLADCKRSPQETLDDVSSFSSIDSVAQDCRTQDARGIEQTVCIGEERKKERDEVSKISAMLVKT